MVIMSMEAQRPLSRSLWLALTAVFVFSAAVRTASAQQIGVTYSSIAQTEAALKSLSPASQLVMENLSNLDTIPVGDLRYFAGDPADAASATFDDSSWQTIQIPFQASKDEVWLRKWVEIPKVFHGYDPTGAKLWLQEPSRGDVVVYRNGQRLARGEDMEPIVLLDPIKPGDKFLLAIRLGKTGDIKRLRRMALRIGFSSNRPNPEVLHAAFVSAAVLFPSLAPGQAVDLKALDSGNAQAFDNSLRKAEGELASLQPLLQKTTLHLTGNSHIDAAWLWPWTETVDVVKRTFGSAAQLMDEYPPYTYTQSAAQYNVWMADKYPQLNDRIKQRIKEGRWEIVGGMWVEPDLNMPDGESLTRQLLIGKRAYKQLYGVDVRIGWNPDSFGYNWQMPQIYKKSGIDYFATQKMSWNETNQVPLKLFWWRSPDGSEILSYFPDGYGNANFSPIRLSNDLAHARTWNPGLDNMLDLYGVGDHGGGPTRALLDEGLKWMAPERIVPKMEFGTAQSYFNNAQGRLAPNSPVWKYKTLADGKAQLPVPPPGEISVPIWNDELYLEFHRGVFTTQSNHKRNMRESEEWVLNAEKYASLAWLDGQRYPADELTGAWKKVTFNQFHDLAAGSGIRWAGSVRDL
jgi:alpha-mannosidase